MIKSLALGLGPRSIRVDCVAPGPMGTPTMAGNVAGGDAKERPIQHMALGRIGQLEVVADDDVVAFYSVRGAA